VPTLRLEYRFGEKALVLSVASCKSGVMRLICSSTSAQAHHSGGALNSTPAHHLPDLVGFGRSDKLTTTPSPSTGSHSSTWSSASTSV